MYGTYCRLNVRVTASDLEVIRAARRKLTKACRRNPAQRGNRKDFYRIMLGYHHGAQGILREWRL
jgi:hypothetical protein